jgi:hypothetical protein
MKNRLFFPQEALDVWVGEDRVEVTDQELVIKAISRGYRLMDAVRVLREVTGAEDAYEIVGKVKTVAYLNELGAELLGTSMLIGDNAYDVTPGFLVTPVAGHVEREDELLSRYLPLPS